MRSLVHSLYTMFALALPINSSAAGHSDFLENFHGKLAELVSHDRTLATKHIAEGVNACIPQQAKAYWSKKTVRDAGVDAYVVTYGLMTPDRSKQQRSKELQEWATEKYYSLSDTDRRDFSRLMKSSFYGAETTFCISKKLHAMI